jgi:hypothetical protein
MKKRHLIIILSLSVMTACRKDDTREVPSAADTAKRSFTVAEAEKWWHTQQIQTAKKDQSLPGSVNKPDKNAPAIDWSNMQSGKADTGNYLFAGLPGTPIFQNVKQGFKKIIFTKDKSGQIHNYYLEVIPDALRFQREQKLTPEIFTGRVFVYDNENKLLGGWLFNNGKRAGAIRPRNTADTTGSNTIKPMKAEPATETCGWTDNNYVNSKGLVVIFSEWNCTYNVNGGGDGAGFPPLGTGAPGYTGGSGGSSSPAPPPVANLPGETNPKINPKDYMACFATLPDAGSKMTVTVYVQEPAPGLPFNIGTNSVGHTAIGLTKTYKGHSITQVVGFYPDATGKDKIHAPSKILDNSGLSYNVSITYSVIPAEFKKIVAFIANSPTTYDIATYNCTNFAYSACKVGGITMPDPVGNMGMGQTGMTPGALGKSIRDVGNVANSNTDGGTVNKTHGPCNN